MAATIELIDGANLFIGDDPTNGKFIVLKSCRIIADLEESTYTHKPGGHVISIDIGDRSFQMPRMTFSLSGPNLDVMTDFMPETKINYTIRGNVRDVRDDTDTSIVTTFRGRMIKASYGEFEKGGQVDGQYEVAEIINYRLTKNGNEALYFDVMSGPGAFRRNGTPMFPAQARNLGLV